jgi:hypothetical protein
LAERGGIPLDLAETALFGGSGNPVDGGGGKEALGGGGSDALGGIGNFELGGVGNADLGESELCFIIITGSPVIELLLELFWIG